ncbi:AzlD domain-containing protein [Clostridium coskatii]|uniref:Branched-chain amino acid transport protein (AzlD) n=1 Tax=Clostridium coskatii TaxID=1705578 RepID=A0A166U1S5_9CLOT|nr:AzlD domain-containing protein [Clostridium coskatii]OAA94459.1 Branched-chain amino acid transport protein (AzlD) [Clostridium coskatii]OBR93203.1 branched-chain amino acid transport protein (AzlD) [Clostridium coskatii]
MNMYIWYIIIGGCIVTILPRTLPVMLISRINISDRTAEFLKYIPISILTALVVSSLFILNNKFCVDIATALSSIITAVVAVKKNNLLLTVIVGVISIAVLRIIF